ncbi:hypothetical protein, partial [Streptomyces parvus]|uniref:hypothetical protein n=1 Tax=Streptomyces parvus TaxID=66428 RepID=UPI001EF3D31B
DAGLHAGPDPADAFARARTLQQIRTLREVLGPDAEQQPGNRELLAALAYVDGLRWRDPGTAARYGDGRMTPDLLDRMVTDWHTADNGTTVDPATGPTPEQYTAFLEAAAGLRAGATPETTLDALLPPPPPELPPDTLVSQPDVLGLSYARSAQITWSLSNAPLPLSELGLGPADTAELARRLHHPELTAATAPTGPQGTPGPEGSPPPPTLPVNSLAVNAYTARHTYGIPEKNFTKFRDLARDRNVVVDVRPTNPSAPKWLDAGAMPKPQDIKAKTVNEVDVLLGADPETIGLVGYFRPVLPAEGSVPHGAWDRVVSRFNQRSTEFRELAGKMAQYEAEGRFVVQDGVVYGVDEAGDRRPITGDHDVFDVSSPDGSRLSHPDHDALIDEMRAKDMAVVHGAHMFWNPPTAFDKSVFDKIVGSHQGPSGEPLLRFTPNSDHAVLTWTQKLRPGQVDSYTARHTYGIPEKNFTKFRDLARDRNVVVDVRPTNPSAPKWLDAGAMPKPQDIKAKTVNEVDVLLGADPETIGLVGYFRPVLPAEGSVPHGAWDRVVSRFNQRSTEFRELAGKMAQYEAEGRFVVQDGVVYGVDEAGDRRPITGDHDVFDVSSPDGSRLSHPDHDALIDEMRAKDMAVVHGAHMFWNPPTAFDKSVFDKIVGSHQGPSGEPLLRFTPNSDHAVLTWTQKLRPGQVDSYTARHTYGIPEKNFTKFRDLARDRNVVVDVRPTNPSAPKWLDAGAMPKPQDIKAKTVNEVDVLLGADPETIGLVGYFRPVLPDQGSVPVDAWDRVVSRFNQRSTEFHELAGKMAQYEADGTFTVHQGIVFGVDDAGGRRPITGDHDLFDVSSPDGSRISPLAHDALIDEMRAKDMAV